MQYSICKETNPNATINRIKGILKTAGIETIEEYYNQDKIPVSTRINIKNTDIGTNGKGTCLKNALASGYAEFIERLQNAELVYFNSPDVKRINLKELTELKFIKNNFNKQNTEEFIKVMKLSEKYDLSENEFQTDFKVYPFFNLQSNDVEYIPYQPLLFYITGTNGMAAGNSFEEAIVQGISEICERYVSNIVFRKRLSLPDIPEKYYKEYDNLVKMVDLYKSNGFNIYIKDASLNQNLPVVCTVIEEIKTGFVVVKFGAHPSLPVAIERTLTEILQGIDLTLPIGENFKTMISVCGNREFDYLLEEFDDNSFKMHLRTFGFIKNNDVLKKMFFSQNSDYEFGLKSWYWEDKTYDNKKTLQFLIYNIGNITNNEIYIRNTAFLGFPSVHIIIPSMSFLYPTEKESLIKIENSIAWSNFSENLPAEYDCLHSLISAIEYEIASRAYGERKVPFEYSALITSVALRDKKRICKYADILIERNDYFPMFNTNGIESFKILREYFREDLSNVEQEQKWDIIQEKYDLKSVKKAREIIKNSNYKNVRYFILREKFFNRAIPLLEEENLIKIQKYLESEYQNNAPLQQVFITLFKDYS